MESYGVRVCKSDWTDRNSSQFQRVLMCISVEKRDFHAPKLSTFARVETRSRDSRWLGFPLEGEQVKNENENENAKLSV